MTSAMTAGVIGPVGAASSRRYGPRNAYVQALRTYRGRWAYRLVVLWTGMWLFIGAWSLFRPFFWYAWSYVPEYGWRAVDQIWRDGSAAFVAERAAERKSFLRMGHAPQWAPELAASVGALLALVLLPGAVATAAHVRERVTGWQGSVVPGYRRANLAAGASVMAGVIVAGFAVAWGIGPWDAVGLLGAVCMIAAIGAGCASLPPRGVAVVGVGAVAVVSFRAVRAWVAFGLTGADPAAGAWMLGIGLAGLGAVWAWLALSRGERQPARQEDLMLGEAWAAWRRRAGEDVTTMRPARRVRLWRVPSSTGLMPAACGLVLLGLIAVIVLVLAGKGTEYAGIAFPLAGLSVMAPAGAVATQWARRLPGIGYEMARPVTRQRFIRDTGVAMAWDWAVWWGWLTVCGSVGVVLSIRTLSREVDARWAPDAVGAWAWFVAGSAAMQVALYGMTAWVMRFQAAWGVYLASLTAALLCWIPLAYLVGLRKQWGDGAVAMAMVGLVGVGMVLAWDAYRRWLRVDVR